VVWNARRCLRPRGVRLELGVRIDEREKLGRKGRVRVRPSLPEVARRETALGSQRRRAASGWRGRRILRHAHLSPQPQVASCLPGVRRRCVRRPRIPRRAAAIAHGHRQVRRVRSPARLQHRGPELLRQGARVPTERQDEHQVPGRCSELRHAPAAAWGSRRQPAAERLNQGTKSSPFGRIENPPIGSWVTAPVVMLTCPRYRFARHDMGAELASQGLAAISSLPALNGPVIL
jgi:hypothetical protein